MTASMTRARAQESAAKLRGRLKDERLRLRLSQAQLAKRTDSQSVTVGSWERGDRAVSMAEFLRWAAELGFEVRLMPAGVVRDFDSVDVMTLIDMLGQAHSQAFKMVMSSSDDEHFDRDLAQVAA